ncbi:Predicted ATP-binding protein involved in virulence [Stigmatella aurantiaca]|uniref:Predicted ATP-binding protein involved in virulence n=1 Tax=Stigmatella aurantiaca TaxID=41 RepID=A0A1H8B0Q4_STIAU|nr:AAA family ATPase [Stigmatella aurantiaca]SEM75704.1 Predicted ATP-binding protein involved in virulence [Stigmatella aurantiaca]
MRALELTIRGFRGIPYLHLPLRPSLTVLVGVNGSGKTTILDALAVLMMALQSRILRGKRKGDRSLHVSDVNTRMKETHLSIQAEVGGEKLSWEVNGRLFFARLQVEESDTDLRRFANELAERQSKNADVSIPLAVYFPTNRAVLDIPQRIRTTHVFDQLAAYDNSLDDNWSNFRLFFEWFRDREDLENEARRDNPDARDVQLEAVRQAVSSLLPGFTDLRIRRQPALAMTVEKDNELLAVDQLSDGEKCVLALAGDLARRLSLAHPQEHQPLAAPALVLIDEIELHLHPGWQRGIIAALKRTFTGCQFVITTHSPQVLSEVHPDDILLLSHRAGAFEVHSAENSFGRDSNWILQTIMGVDARPPRVGERLRSCFQLIDEGRLKEAREEKNALAREIGDDDPELLRAELILRRKELLTRAPHS